MSDDSIEKFRIEEYKQLREEIKVREQAIVQLFTVTVTVSATILSAVAAFTFRSAPSSLAALNPGYAYAFLAPLTLIIPLFFVLCSHRRDIHRAGTYLYVFYEESRDGPLWETRMTAYRSRQQRESLDPLPLTFWALTLLSAIGFFFALASIVPVFCSLPWLIGGLVVIGCMVLLGVGHMCFRQVPTSIHQRDYCLWSEIREKEQRVREEEVGTRLTSHSS